MQRVEKEQKLQMVETVVFSTCEDLMYLGLAISHFFDFSR